jgi:hypothetical protein
LNNLLDLPDGEKILEIVMHGRPATKKTSQRIVKRGRFIKLLPSIRYENYEKACQETFEGAWKNLGNKPIPVGVGIKLTITLDSWVLGDTVGYMQAIGDILEKYGVVANDQLIHWIDLGTHMITMPDKESPKAKIEIYRFRHPVETRPNFASKYDQEDEELQIDKPKKKKRNPSTAKTKTAKKTTRKKTV